MEEQKRESVPYQELVLPIVRTIPCHIGSSDQFLNILPRIVNLCTLNFPNELGYLVLYYEPNPNDTEEIRKLGTRICIGCTTNGELNLRQQTVTPEGWELIKQSHTNSTIAQRLYPASVGLLMCRLKGKLIFQIHTNPWLKIADGEQLTMNVVLVEQNLYVCESGTGCWLFS